MRDYVLTTLILAGMPVGLFRPFYGLLVYVWVSYMYPQEYAWSFARELPVAKLTAICVLLGMLLNGSVRGTVVRRREILVMLLLWTTFTLSSVFSIYPADAWAKWQDVTKLIVMGILTAMLLTDRKRIAMFFGVLAVSLGFYGFKGGLFSIATGGQYTIWGPGNSILGGNNNIGLALNMVLPVLWCVAAEQEGWRKRLVQLGFLLTIPAIMFTYSRASALTMPVVLLALLLKSRHRLAYIMAAIFAVFLALPFVPQSFWQRQETIVTYEDDASATSRIDMWKISWRLAIDRPLTGGGFNFQSRDVFQQYGPEILEKYGTVWDTHNVFFSILAGHGFPGLFAFTGLIGICVLGCTSLERSARISPELAWIGNYAIAIRISLFAFLINGMFVNMEYFDLLYQFVGVIVSLRLIRDVAVVAPQHESAFRQPVPAAI